MQQPAISDLKLTPDLFPYHVSDTTPTLEVSWPGGARAVLGNVLTPTQVQNSPSVRFADAEEHANYVIVMTDPDAPSRADPRFREWWHWIVTNVPGPDLKRGDISKGHTLWTYVGAAPPQGTGLHRYVIVAYKQKSKTQKFETAEKGMTATGRGKNHLEQFATKHSLGHPAALACFQAEYDDYVPEVYKKLG